MNQSPSENALAEKRTLYIRVIRRTLTNNDINDIQQQLSVDIKNRVAP